MLILCLNILSSNWHKNCLNVILPDLTSLTLERLHEEINKLYLNNVEINYEINDEEIFNSYEIGQSINLKLVKSLDKDKNIIKSDLFKIS